MSRESEVSFFMTKRSYITETTGSFSKYVYFVCFPRKLFFSMDCSICIQSCIRNQTAVGDLIQTHCNHIFHSNCLDKWNYSGQATAAACPNCRTELIAFFIDETDNENIIEANTFIPNGSQIFQ